VIGPRPSLLTKLVRLAVLAVGLVAVASAADAQSLARTAPVPMVSAGPIPAEADRQRRARRVERRRLLAANVGLTAALTLARGVLGGTVDDAGGGAAAVGWGAVAGLGFYLAKDAVGRGDEALGVGLAFASASLAENAGGGGGPLGHVRVGFGPLDLRLRTPLASDGAGPVLATELDPIGATALLAAPVAGGRPIVRGGALLYVYDDLGETRHYRRRGNTIGRVARVDATARDEVVRHEIIHQIQAVQVSAVTPFGTVGAVWPDAVPTAAGGDVRADLRLDWLYLTLGALNLVVADDPRDRPSEIEAYELDEPPPTRMRPVPVRADTTSTVPVRN
jgi:hypothetical protein